MSEIKQMIKFLDEQTECRQNVQEHDYLWTEALEEDLAILTEIKETLREQSLLREFLWINHGCPPPALYGDDGEMQCGKCRLDFKRQPAQELLDHIRGSRIEEMKNAKPQPDEKLVKYFDGILLFLANHGFNKIDPRAVKIRKLLKGGK